MLVDWWEGNERDGNKLNEGGSLRAWEGKGIENVLITLKVGMRLFIRTLYFFENSFSIFYLRNYDFLLLSLETVFTF